MQFYGSKLSENMAKTPEGYLICRNVNIGRTGEQTYYGQELGINDKYDEPIKVYRLPEDVFDKVAMASFEGKPFTNNHPSEHVDVNNVDRYSKGHIQNIRQDGDYLVGDIIVEDPNVISEIENNLKREISLGYDCFYEPYMDGYRQTKIRGNHVAIVTKGRAGSHVCIKDSQPEQRSNNMSKKSKILAAMFKSYARDASTEEVAEAMEAVNEAKDECTEVKDSEEEKGILTKIKDMFEGKPAEEAKDEEPQPSVEERLAKLEDAIANLNPVKDEEPKEDDIIEDEEELEEEVRDEDPEEEGEEEEDKEVKIEVSDSAIKALRQSIAKISNVKERRMVSDALRESLRGSTQVKDSGYTAVRKAMEEAAAKRTQDSQAEDLRELGHRIAAKFNPHFKGEK